MDKKIVNAILLTLAFLLALTFNVAAQAPNTIVYQGRLTDNLGDPITTTTSVTFMIYTTASAGVPVTGGTFTQDVTPDENGVFTVELGPVNTTILNGNKLYLAIKVGADAEMTPRQLITSVPYAYAAANIADNAVTSAKIASGAVATADLANDAVTSAKIVDYTITGNDIANSTLTGTKIENGSIDKFDLLDEVGICRSSLAGSIISVATSGVTIIDSATITINAAGYILALGSCFASLSGTSFGVVIAEINMNGTTLGNNYVAWGFGNETTATSYNRWGSLNPEYLYYASSAGNYKFYFIASRGSYTGGSASIYYPKLDLIYIPASMGTVSAIVPGSEATNFDKAEAINPLSDPNAPIITSETFYKVDLRELELKAARAREEAERAEKELLEAKLRQLQENENQD